MGGIMTEDELERMAADIRDGKIVRTTKATPLTGDLAGPYPPPLATAASLDALRAEVAALKKELDNLRVVVATLRAESEGTGPQPYQITACPRCCSSALYYSTFGYVDGRSPKYQIECRDCNWKRYD